MKTQNFLMIIILLASVLVTSCDKIEDAKEFEFDATFEGYMDVYVPPEKGAVPFDAWASVDVTTHQQFMDNLDRIEELNITSLTGTVDTITKDITLNWAILKAYSGDDTAKWEFYSLPITIGTVLTLGNADGQWNTINNIVLSGNGYTVELHGEASEGDVYWSLLIENTFKVKGKL